MLLHHGLLQSNQVSEAAAGPGLSRWCMTIFCDGISCVTPVMYRQAYDCLGEVGSHLSLLLAHSMLSLCLQYCRTFILIICRCDGWLQRIWIINRSPRSTFCCSELLQILSLCTVCLPPPPATADHPPPASCFPSPRHTGRGSGAVSIFQRQKG